MAKYRAGDGGQLEVEGAPVYYERRPERVDGQPGIRLDYWLLFGLEGYPDGTDADALTREGDWERVSVQLRRGDVPEVWEPVTVGFYIHGRRRDVPWSSAEVAATGDGRAPTHPVAYAARGNHTPYPDAGVNVVRHESPVGGSVRAPDERLACRDCPQWRTWRHLRPVEREPWYGYGGAWGAITSGGNSSPIGPSRYTR